LSGSEKFFFVTILNAGQHSCIDEYDIDRPALV
jgi:hypothetical protein